MKLWSYGDHRRFKAMELWSYGARCRADTGGKLQRFKAHHPPTFRGGGDPMIANHWFQQVEKILEAMPPR